MSNPPYSKKWPRDETTLLINAPRFASAGVLAPRSKADLAFIMHALSWLASNLFFGTSITICIMALKKSKPNNTVLFMDATAGCMKGANKN